MHSARHFLANWRNKSKKEIVQEEKKKKMAPEAEVFPKSLNQT